MSAPFWADSGWDWDDYEEASDDADLDLDLDTILVIDDADDPWAQPTGEQPW